MKTHWQAEVERLDQRRFLAPLNLVRSHQAKYQSVLVFIPGQLEITNDVNMGTWRRRIEAKGFLFLVGWEPLATTTPPHSPRGLEGEEGKCFGEPDIGAESGTAPL